MQAVSWFLRYPLSYRDIEELLLERGLEVDHSTVNRWVLAYAPLIERRLHQFRKPHCGSIRVDEIYIRIRGEWRYLYRAVDKHGEAVDVLLTARRDLDAARRFFRKALKGGPLLSPDRVGTDGASTYPPALKAARNEGLLSRDPVHHVTKHIQQGSESDHNIRLEDFQAGIAVMGLDGEIAKLLQHVHDQHADALLVVDDQHRLPRLGVAGRSRFSRHFLGVFPCERGR